jgi:hypothetical protein
MLEGWPKKGMLMFELRPNKCLFKLEPVNVVGPIQQRIVKVLVPRPTEGMYL